VRYHSRNTLQAQERMHVHSRSERRKLPEFARPSSSKEIDMDVPNGTAATDLPAVTWQKSRRSNPSGNCVELAGLPGGDIAVRNSRDPGGPALIYTHDEIVAFIAGARDGDFDNLVA
jgi:hypothetical protein